MTCEHGHGVVCHACGDALSLARAEIRWLTAELEKERAARCAAVVRAESAEFGCKIAYQREPTQAEATAHADGSDEAFVPMGEWTALRCLDCGRWVFGGPTRCVACVVRAERDAARADADRIRDVLAAIAAPLAIDGENHAEAVKRAREALR